MRAQECIPRPPRPINVSGGIACERPSVALEKSGYLRGLFKGGVTEGGNSALPREVQWLFAMVP